MFEVRNVDATAVTEFEVLSGDRILGEKENLPPGFSGSLSLRLAPGTYELYCPGADTERGELTVVGELDAVGSDRRRRRPRRRRRRVPRLRPQPGHGDADGRRRARRGDPARRRRGVQAGLHPGPAVLRADRAGGRVVRARRRNLDAAIDVRADDVDAEPISRASTASNTDCGPTASTDGLADVSAQLVTDVASLQQLIDGLERAAGVRPRQRRRRPARRGRDGQDHRRGGALLAHRPARLRGQRGRVRAGRSPTSSRPDEDRPRSAGHDQGALRRPRRRRPGLADPTEPSRLPAVRQADHASRPGSSPTRQAVAEPLTQVAAKVVAA